MRVKARSTRKSASSEPEPKPGSADVVVAYKRAQVLIAADTNVRFAGPVRSALTYRADDIFVCPRGHRRIEPLCSCGFYAVTRREALQPSVVTTAVLEVALEGRFVRHPSCVRAERQRVRQVIFDGWCTYCIAPAASIAGIRPAWHEFPEPWRRAVPVCAHHAAMYPLVTTLSALAGAVEADVSFDCTSESRVARSLRRERRPRRPLSSEPPHEGTAGHVHLAADEQLTGDVSQH